MATTASIKTATAGLEDVVIGPSEITDVNGQAGQLIYRGYDIHDLVAHTSFAEVVYLLWRGSLPTRSELDALQQDINKQYDLPPDVIGMLRQCPKDAEPMAVLRTAVSRLSFYDPEPKAKVDDPDVNRRRATRLLAKLPAIVGAWQRIRNGQEPVQADPSLSFAANVLYMLSGKRPDDRAEHAFNMALILHADHELNASTFSARVTAATLADMYSAIVSAIGTLSGPLHGGANTAVMRMLLQIKESGESPKQWIERALGEKRKIMGFGHRVYKTEDPRATHLRRMSEELGKRYGQPEWFQMSQEIEQAVKADKGLNANVDFYSASTYYVMGIPIDLYTPLFACSRVSGWTAHVLEQYAHNRLIRPRAEYVGPRGLKVVPIDQRT
ncbi:MAG TPA: citrate synthase [Gemmatimonadaceae bacterium]|nr:citrate synthase [Gemmatimonadaceae bacterium]